MVIFSTMYWYFVFCIITLHASRINGQRRALVYYHQTSTAEPEPVSENPLSSSINSIQTGREELTAFYRGDTGSGGSHRRGYHKTTTPPYFKEPFLKGDNGNTGKTPPSSSSKSSSNDEKSQESQITQLQRENRSAGDPIIFKDKGSTGMEVPSSTVRPDITSETGRNSQRKDTAKEGMDINKSISSREQDRRSNTQESRRHTTTPLSSSNAKFNSSVRDNAEKHREEPLEKTHSERPNKDRRPTPSAENTRGHRPATRSTSEKGQILTHPTPRTPTGQRYDRTEQPSVSSGSHDGKATDRHLDTRDPPRNVDDKKKDLDVESDLGDKVYSTGNGDRTKLRDYPTDSSDPSKPTYALGEEERPSETSRNPDGYRDELTGGEKGDMNGKVGSDIEKSSGSGERKPYAERSYPRDEEERSPGHHVRDSDRGYTRRHRDRYDERSYDERSSKSNQTRRGQERTATYDPRDSTAGRTSRPRDRSYDEEYRDVYSSRDAVKSSDNIPKDRTRASRRPYTGSGDDVDDRDRYPEDGTPSYRDYSGDSRYSDERRPTDRDSRRRYRDEDNKKYSDESSRRTSYYDDYEETDTYRDDYGGRYEKDGESRRYRDDVTRRYSSTGSRRYDEQEARRPSEYDRPVRRYKDDDEYKYNNTRRYRDSYDVYRDDNRRSSGESVGSHRYDERDGTRSTRYDEEEYKGSRSYSTRDSDPRYVRRDHEDTSRQRETTRKYTTDDVTRYRGDDDDRYRDETRTYSGSSSRDGYDQNRRTYEDGSTYIGTRTFEERSETDTRRDYDDVNRRTSSRRTYTDGSYSTYPYAEDEYYNNRTSTGYADRYNRTDRPIRKTGDDYSGFVSSDGDDRKYSPGSSEERRRDKDKTYADNPASRRRTDTDGIRGDTRRVYEEDRRSDRDRVDSYDERTYRDRDADEYIRSSRGRDYDTPVYRDSDDEIDPRNYRSREDADINDRYRGDGTVRDRITYDEIQKPQQASGRNRDKGYSDRTHEDRYQDRSSEGTYRHREDDDRYKYLSSEDRKPEYRDSDRSSRGTQRFRDEYDTSYDRDSNIPRNADERSRGGTKSNRREDRLAGDRTDYEDKAPEPERSSKSDTSLRSDTKTEFPDRRGDESLSKGERSSYDDESRRDRRRSRPRDIQPSSIPPKTRSSEDRPDSLDKGDFGRGRRTFYNEDDKTDSDREERGKSSREDRLPRTDGNEELSYTRNEKDRGSAYDTRDSRQNGRSNTDANSEGRTYSSRRETTDTNRHRTNDEIPVIRTPSDLLPASDDAGYSDRKEDAANPTISKGDQGSQRRYSSSTNERSGRRQLPSVREPDLDRPPRKEESEDSSLPDYRGGYRYTKSREDFERQPDDRSFSVRDEYNPRGGKSSKGLDADTIKGEYGSPGPGTPTRNKQDRISEDSEHQNKEEYYTSVRDKASSRDGKSVDDSPERRDSERRDKVVRDRDERGIYENGEYHRSSSQEELKFVGENSTRDHSNEDARSNKENDYSTLSVGSQGAPGGRSQGSTISRSATPIPHFQDKELISRNVSSRNISDKFSGSAIYREKRFQYDDRFNTNNASRGLPAMNDELSKRPLTTKEVIDAAYRHSEETEKQREIFYPVYVPGSGNMTSPNVIRPSERRGITTPTRKKKKK